MKNNQIFTINSDIKDIDISGWRKLLEESITTSVFQSAEMFKFFEGLNGFQPFVFSVCDPSEKMLVLISGVILQEGTGVKAKITKRAIIYGGPLLANSSETRGALAYLLDNLNRYLSKNAIYAETRNLNNYDDFKEVFKK